MNLKFVCPYWGQENLSPSEFIDKITDAAYDGIEILMPADDNFCDSFMAEMEDVYEKNDDFIFIAQQLITPGKVTITEFIKRFENELQKLISYQPTYINSHTGKDYFSFDNNCRLIEASLNISAKTGTRILHETHRGRFSFHAATLLAYLEKFPELELVGDFSHFCVVSESVLQDQQNILAQIIPKVSHIHARVGFEQAPQVNDPFAPEWENHLKYFEGWWQKIIDHKKKAGWNTFNITPEFGPAPYMPLLPFTKQPIGNQWEINKAMMQRLKSNLLESNNNFETHHP